MNSFRKMLGLFRKVMITSRRDMWEAVNLAIEIAQFFRDKGLTVVFEAELASRLGEVGVPLEQTEADLVVVVGGDGTVLRVVHNIKSRAPLFTVKMGRVGFFADVLPEDTFPALEKILNQEFFRDECFMLKTNLEISEALNEFRIGTVIPQQMMDISISINGNGIVKDRVDAVVVSTSVGSSAYALSAGASIVDPRIEAILIVPICPLSTNFKPYIVPSNVVVSIKPESKMEYIILADGRAEKKFEQPFEIKIWKSERKTVFLRTKQNFYERIRRRLQVSSFDL